MEEILQQIANLGFPIVVAMYLLVRLDRRLEVLTVCIQTLTAVLEHGE